MARRRILLEGVPVERHAPGTPVFFIRSRFGPRVYGLSRREDSSTGWTERDAGRPAGGRLPPPAGRIRTTAYPTKHAISDD